MTTIAATASVPNSASHAATGLGTFGPTMSTTAYAAAAAPTWAIAGSGRKYRAPKIATQA